MTGGTRTDLGKHKSNRSGDGPSTGGLGSTATALLEAAPTLGARWTELDTPALLVDLDRLDANMSSMALAAAQNGLALRPHFKTHKSVALARQQLELGAVGTTVTKLDEAAALVEAGFEAPILLAYEIVAEPKLSRAMALAARARLILAVDSSQGAVNLARSARGGGLALEVWIEVDSGLNRCGVQPADAPALALAIMAHSELRLTGAFTHAGQAYGARSPSEVEIIAEAESRAVVEAAGAIRQAGFDVTHVSAGSTPTARFLRGGSGLTEMRPGTYVFNDCMQVALGTVGDESCALTVATTIISRPTPTHAVIDAGSKTLGLDRGAHSYDLLDDFGRLMDADGRLVRLSEEHGVLSLPPGSSISVGDRLRVIPNHVCSVTNLGRALFGLRGGIVEKVIPIDASGGVH